MPDGDSLDSEVALSLCQRQGIFRWNAMFILQYGLEGEIEIIAGPVDRAGSGKFYEHADYAVHAVAGGGKLYYMDGVVYLTGDSPQYGPMSTDNLSEVMESFRKYFGTLVLMDNLVVYNPTEGKSYIGYGKALVEDR